METKSLKATYEIVVEGYDWGCGVSKTIVHFDDCLDSIETCMFEVLETKQITDFTQVPLFPIVENTQLLKVIDAYYCDKNGQRIEKISQDIALEFYVSPTDASPLIFDFHKQVNMWSDPYYLTISINNISQLTSQGVPIESICIDSAYTKKTTSADMFHVNQYGIYQYAYYKPQQETKTLIVWLHGLGEGGTENTDPYVTLLGNKVTVLSSEEFQRTIGYAHILVPQCPTYWMDNDGKGSNFIDGRIESDGTSYYSESLYEFIMMYKEKCGAQKVLLAGCSNGGYMTMVMAINHPHDFYGIIPICEALSDRFISDEDIQSIKDIPMFYIYSKDDTVVIPSLHEIPTIERLKKAHAKNLHVSTTDHVIDTSGCYKGEDGQPYQYLGHWSWIYFFNNESNCDESQISVWQWIKEVV